VPLLHLRPHRRPGPARRALALVVSAALLAGLAACGDDEPLSDAAEESLSSSTTGPADTEAGAGGGAGSGEGEEGPGAGGLGGGVVPGQENAAGTALRDPDGAVMGSVLFETVEQGTRVTVEIVRAGDPDTFHGFHVHANDEPSNGEGCIAQPGAAPAEWFASADGHLVAEGEDSTHAGHQGDMPPLFTLADGNAAAQFVTDRFGVNDLLDRAIVLHAGPDNLGNVPVGEGPSTYTPNSPRAVELTEGTGNAGDRIGCGVVETGAGAAGDPAR